MSNDNVKNLFIIIQIKNIKITILGKGVVGKSSLTYRFINYNAPQEHDPTIEDKYKQTTMINNEQYEIEVLDTAGEDDYQNMLDSWINFGDGFLLVFAINDEESFKLLEQKRARIIKNKNNNNIPIILVGNKQDLNDERKVEFSDAKNLADSWGCEYIETSAKTNFRCKEAFEKLASKIVENQNTKPTGKNCPCCIIF